MFKYTPTQQLFIITNGAKSIINIKRLPEMASRVQIKCTLNYCLDWDKWALTNLSHEWQ